MSCSICGRDTLPNSDEEFSGDICPFHTEQEIEEHNQFEEDYLGVVPDIPTEILGPDSFGGDEYFDKEKFEDMLRELNRDE